MCSGFKKFVAEEHQNLCKLQHINATQGGFYGANMVITTQDKISKALDNLSMATNSEKDILNHLTSTTKQLAETNKNLTDKIKTQTATNARLI